MPQLGGKNNRDLVYNCLNFLFTPNVVNYYTWTGRSKKNLENDVPKRAMEKTTIIAMLLGEKIKLFFLFIQNISKNFTY